MASEASAESSQGRRLTRKQKKELGRQIWSGSPGLEVVHRDAAGIDIGSREHYMAVGPDRDARPVQSFRCFTHGGVAHAMWRLSRGAQSRMFVT